MTREQIIDRAMAATDRDRNREWPRSIFCSALQGYGGMRCEPPDTGLRVCAPLEYDEPDPAPDVDDDECDDDEYGPIDVLAELIRSRRNPDDWSGYGSARPAGGAGATPGAR